MRLLYLLVALLMATAMAVKKNDPKKIQSKKIQPKKIQPKKIELKKIEPNIGPPTVGDLPPGFTRYRADLVQKAYRTKRNELVSCQSDTSCRALTIRRESLFRR